MSLASPPTPPGIEDLTAKIILLLLLPAHAKADTIPVVQSESRCLLKRNANVFEVELTLDEFCIQYKESLAKMAIVDGSAKEKAEQMRNILGLTWFLGNTRLQSSCLKLTTNRTCVPMDNDPPSVTEQRANAIAKFWHATSLPRMKDGRRPPVHIEAVSDGEKFHAEDKQDATEPTNHPSTLDSRPDTPLQQKPATPEPLTSGGKC